MSNTPHLLAGINWVDIVAFIIFLRVIFMGLKNGVATEAFKVVGTIIAVYVSLHYYRTISAFIGNKYILDARILEGCVFAVLACMAYAAIGIIRLVVGRLVNMTVVPAISRWGGCLLAILRAFLMTSLLFYFSWRRIIPTFKKRKGLHIRHRVSLFCSIGIWPIMELSHVKACASGNIQ